MEVLIFYLLGCAVALVMALGEEYRDYKSFFNYRFDWRKVLFLFVFSWISVILMLFLRWVEREFKDE